MEIKTDKLPAKIESVNTLLDNKVKQTDNVKTAIDILATKTALEQEGTVQKIVEEKTAELKNDAEAKRVKAETERVNEEIERVKAEKTKEIEEYDKIITIKQKEVDKLKAESDKAQAFFESNKEILSYIGIRNKKSLKVMQWLMIPATVLFVLIQFLIFPITVVGKTLEALIEIVGGICNSIKNNALKIIVSILVLILIAGVVFLVYFYGIKVIN